MIIARCLSTTRRMIRWSWRNANWSKLRAKLSRSHERNHKIFPWRSVYDRTWWLQPFLAGKLLLHLKGTLLAFNNSIIYWNLISTSREKWVLNVSYRNKMFVLRNITLREAELYRATFTDNFPGFLRGDTFTRKLEGATAIKPAKM